MSASAGAQLQGAAQLSCLADSQYWLLRSGKWYLGAAHGTAGVLQALLLFLETCGGSRSQEAGAFIMWSDGSGSCLSHLGALTTCGVAAATAIDPWF